MTVAKDLAPVNPENPEEGTKKPSIVAKNAALVAGARRIVRFRGRPMVLELLPYPHFVPLHRENFDKLAYPLLGGVSRSRVADVFAFVSNTAEDLTDQDHYILFGTGEGRRVWDMRTLDWGPDARPEDAVWRSPYAPAEDDGPVPFVMSLAGGDQGQYDDIMQSLAPLVMEKKPDGVIWWIGDGANGKSTLMDAIYKIFPGQLSSITVKRLVDGRDTPSLNGTLANVVKESSEGRIEDTEIYKSIGTHEDFRVHKFHSQDDIAIRGNIHHIFSGNSVPTFNDKGWSARRRTFIVPFGQRFESDPTFEEKTFTVQMFGHLISEMCRYAVRLREQGYRYKWSAITRSAKIEYDSDANNAEVYARSLIDDEGVVAFDTFSAIKMDYENWCGDNGYVPLGITNLRRAMTNLGFARTSKRTNDYVTNVYTLPDIRTDELQKLGMDKPGLWTMPGFKRKFEPKETTQEEVDERQHRLKGDW